MHHCHQDTNFYSRKHYSSDSLQQLLHQDHVGFVERNVVGLGSYLVVDEVVAYDVDVLTKLHQLHRRVHILIAYSNKCHITCSLIHIIKIISLA